MPSAAGDEPEVRALPVWTACLEACAPTSEYIAGAWSWAQDNHQGSGLVGRLDKYWELVHRPIVADGTEVPPAADEGDCYAAGICLCDDDGILLHKVGKRLLAYMKVIYPTSSSMKEKLLDGKLILKLEGKIPGGDGGPAAEAGTMLRWVHVGHMSLKPYKPRVLLVEPTDDLSEHEPNTARLYFRGVDFAAFYIALLPVAKCTEIWCQWYELEDTEKELGRFVPEPLPALRLPAYEEPERFFPRRLPRRAAGGPAAAAAADGGDDEVLPSDLDLGSAESGDECPSDEEPLLAIEALVEEVVAAYEVPVDVELPGDAGAVDGAGRVEPEPPLEAAAMVVEPPPLPPPVDAPRPRAPRMAEMQVIAVVGGHITFFRPKMAISRQVANAIELSGAHCQQQGRGLLLPRRQGGRALGRHHRVAGRMA